MSSTSMPDRHVMAGAESVPRRAVGTPLRSAVQPRFEIGRLTPNDIRYALSQGYADLRACRTDMTTMAILYPLAAIFIAGVFAVQGLLPFVFPICAGFALIGPMATLWFTALSRQREIAGAVDAASAAAVFDTPRLDAIQRLGLTLVLLYLVWVGVAWEIYANTLGASSAMAGASFLARVFETGAGQSLIVIGCAVGALFAVVTLALSFVAFALVLDRDVSASRAMATSLRVAARNPVPVLGWGAVVVAALVLGALPGLLGLAVVLPLLGHASWHLYRRALPDTARHPV